MAALTVPELLDSLRPPAGGRRRVFLPAGAAELLALAEAYRDQPDAAAGLDFVSIQIPGANTVDWAGLHPDAQAEGTFVSADWRASFDAGRFQLRPMSWGQAGRWLAETPLDAIVLHVTPPDADGLVGFGVNEDFQPILAARPERRIALLNPLMPVTRGGARLRLADFDDVVEAPHALAGYDPGGTDPVSLAIAERVAALIPANATVQVGVGKLGAAMLQVLGGFRGLRIFSGFVGEGVLGLLDSGAVEQVVTGAALGSAELHRRVAADPRVTFAPVTVTHDAAHLAAQPRLVAVNSALEIDLLGQANAEVMNGRIVSGVGGLAEFLRGARASAGGVPVLALSSSAKRGEISRIVPRLADGCVSVPRGDVGVVVTEHGVADLRGATLDARAAALIAVAEPRHRAALAAAWADMRARM